MKKWLVTVAGLAVPGLIYFSFPISKTKPMEVAKSPQKPRLPASKPQFLKPPAFSPTSKKTLSTETLIQLENEITELSHCYTQDCGASHDDARTDYYDLGQKIRQKLIQYQEFVNLHQIQDPSVSKFARLQMENSDGHVQEAALDLIATQKPSTENLQSILEKIIQGSDAELIQQALLELRRYSSPTDQDLIRESLGKALLTGAPFVSRTIAENSNLFITSQNIQFFEDLIQRLDPKSAAGTSLQASLKEFRRKSSAG